MSVILDSYASTNQNLWLILDTAYPEINEVENGYSLVGQSVATPNDGLTSKLSSLSFYMKKDVDFEGTVKVEVYTHTGTYGTSSLPTGAALASSTVLDEDAFDVAGLAAMITFPFTGANIINLSPNTYYVVVIKLLTITDADHPLYVGADNSSPSHAGNTVVWTT